jgi:hypothetical protein
MFQPLRLLDFDVQNFGAGYNGGALALHSDGEALQANLRAELAKHIIVVFSPITLQHL